MDAEDTKVLRCSDVLFDGRRVDVCSSGQVVTQSIFSQMLQKQADDKCLETTHLSGALHLSSDFTTYNQKQ